MLAKEAVTPYERVLKRTFYNISLIYDIQI